MISFLHWCRLSAVAFFRGPDIVNAGRSSNVINDAYSWV